MKKLFLFVLIAGLSGNIQAQDIINKAKKEIEKATGGKTSFSNDEIVRGLKEALQVGSNNASSSASRVNGFYSNPLIKIPFPPEIEIVETTARQLGFGKKVDSFVRSLNRAAEEASKQAAPVFLDAIQSMTITDGLNILKGTETAATDFLKNKTTPELTAQLNPIVKRAIAKTKVAKYWKPVITRYNRLPGVSKKNANLDEYITEKTVEGLFKLIAQEEIAIRQDPAARVTDILRKVFGQ